MSVAWAKIMNQATHNKIVSFICRSADDVLRDLFKRGQYPDVILPMCVIRRMDAVLEPTKKAVLDTKKMLDKSGITEQRAALADVVTGKLDVRKAAARLPQDAAPEVSIPEEAILSEAELEPIE